MITKEKLFIIKLLTMLSLILASFSMLVGCGDDSLDIDNVLDKDPTKWSSSERKQFNDYVSWLDENN